jgi:hypothetical protein
MFELVRAKWNDYWTENIAQGTHQWTLAGEVEVRLEQFDIVLEYLDQALAAEVAARGGPTPPHDRAWDEIVLFGETFYFVAWRLVVILDSAAYPFPGMNGFKRNVPGIREVRNDLIEHPEKTPAKPFARELAITEDGPVLKSLARRKAGERPNELDRGLLVDARELRDALMARLEASG